MAEAIRQDDDLITVDQFYATIPDGQKADLIDGVIYVASPDTRRSDQINRFISYLMDGFSTAHDLGECFGSRFAFRLSEHRAPEPDVAFVSAARLQDVITETEGLGPPDIAVEIVSRDSKSRDYKEKHRLYESSGVNEYWRIDPLKKRCDFLRLRDGRYEQVALDDGRIFRSEAMPGFWLDVTWLLARPLPNKVQCLQQILAGRYA